jgi:hypothetical protein
MFVVPADKPFTAIFERFREKVEIVAICVLELTQGLFVAGVLVACSDNPAFTHVSADAVPKKEIEGRGFKPELPVARVFVAAPDEIKV